MYIEVITNKNTYRRIEELLFKPISLDDDIIVKLRVLKEFTRPFSKVMMDYRIIQVIGKDNLNVSTVAGGLF